MGWYVVSMAAPGAPFLAGPLIHGLPQRLLSSQYRRNSPSQRDRQPGAQRLPAMLAAPLTTPRGKRRRAPQQLLLGGLLWWLKCKQVDRSSTHTFLPTRLIQFDPSRPTVAARIVRRSARQVGPAHQSPHGSASSIMTCVRSALSRLVDDARAPAGCGGGLHIISPPAPQAKIPRGSPDHRERAQYSGGLLQTSDDARRPILVHGYVSG